MSEVHVIDAKKLLGIDGQPSQEEIQAAIEAAKQAEEEAAKQADKPLLLHDRGALNAQLFRASIDVHNALNAGGESPSYEASLALTFDYWATFVKTLYPTKDEIA